jgi:hypothetical protein
VERRRSRSPRIHVDQWGDLARWWTPGWAGSLGDDGVKETVRVNVTHYHRSVPDRLVSLVPRRPPYEPGPRPAPTRHRPRQLLSREVVWGLGRTSVRRIQPTLMLFCPSCREIQIPQLRYS